MGFNAFITIKPTIHPGEHVWNLFQASKSRKSKICIPNGVLVSEIWGLTLKLRENPSLKSNIRICFIHFGGIRKTPNKRKHSISADFRQGLLLLMVQKSQTTVGCQPQLVQQPDFWLPSIVCVPCLVGV